MTRLAFSECGRQDSNLHGLFPVRESCSPGVSKTPAFTDFATPAQGKSHAQRMGWRDHQPEVVTGCSRRGPPPQKRRLSGSLVSAPQRAQGLRHYVTPGPLGTARRTASAAAGKSSPGHQYRLPSGCLTLWRTFGMSGKPRAFSSLPNTVSADPIPFSLIPSACATSAEVAPGRLVDAMNCMNFAVRNSPSLGPVGAATFGGFPARGLTGPAASNSRRKAAASAGDAVISMPLTTILIAMNKFSHGVRHLRNQFLHLSDFYHIRTGIPPDYPHDEAHAITGAYL